MKPTMKRLTVVMLMVLAGCAHNPLLLHQASPPEVVAVKFWEYNFHQEFEKAYYLLGRDARRETTPEAYTAAMKLLFFGLARAYGNNNQQMFEAFMRTIQFKAVEIKATAFLARVKLASDLNGFLVFTNQERVAALEKAMGYFTVILVKDDVEGWRIQQMNQEEEGMDDDAI